RFLGAYLARKTGRDLVLWPGTCIVHEQFSERELVRLRTRHPNAKLAAHPECPESILQMADHVGSTSSLLSYVTNAPDKEFIIATEPHIIHQMQKRSPDKIFIPVPGMDESCSCNNCPFMALNTLEKLYRCLRDMKPALDMPEELRRAAFKPLQRMLDMSPKPAQLAGAA
ncbi:MAG: quinolinate synthase NadA, partial [Alphaproteobacteria bacterium]